MNCSPEEEKREYLSTSLIEEVLPSLASGSMENFYNNKGLCEAFAVSFGVEKQALVQLIQSLAQRKEADKTLPSFTEDLQWQRDSVGQ